MCVELYVCVCTMWWQRRLYKHQTNARGAVVKPQLSNSSFITRLRRETALSTIERGKLSVLKKLTKLRGCYCVGLLELFLFAAIKIQAQQSSHFDHNDTVDPPR